MDKPLEVHATLVDIDCGVTLRDLFAGQALVVMAKSYEAGDAFAHIAQQAYVLADAMLKERDK